MKAQLNIFGTEPITVAESIELTIQSLIQYGSLHDHWAMAWSWGKDSTTLDKPHYRLFVLANNEQRVYYDAKIISMHDQQTKRLKIKTQPL